VAGKPKKTLRVDYIKGEINRRLALKTISVEQRKALAGILEDLLFEANDYRGFNDVYWRDEGGYQAWVEAGRPDFPEKYKYIHGPDADGQDQYRRVYY
jgi:hypothetical protein